MGEFGPFLFSGYSKWIGVLVVMVPVVLLNCLATLKFGTGDTWKKNLGLGVMMAVVSPVIICPKYHLLLIRRVAFHIAASMLLGSVLCCFFTMLNPQGYILGLLASLSSIFVMVVVSGVISVVGDSSCCVQW